MPFITQKRTIGGRIEATPYVRETLTSADYNFRAFNISYTPEIENVARKYASGDYSAFSSVIGKRSMTVSFSVHLAPGSYSDLTTVPEFGKFLRGCAFRQEILAGGVRYVTHSDECGVPLTIEVAEEQCGATNNDLVIAVRGAMGNVNVVLDGVGQPVRLDFEFTGVLDGITDRLAASRIAPTGFPLTEPDAVLASSITAFSENQTIDTMSINVGNQVELYIDPTSPQGYRGAHVVNRDPTVSLDPYLELVASRGNFGRWTAGTTGSFQASIGSYFTLSAPAFQIVNGYAAGDRQGMSINSIEGILTRFAGDDEFRIVQGAE